MFTVHSIFNGILDSTFFKFACISFHLIEHICIVVRCQAEWEDRTFKLQINNLISTECNALLALVCVAKWGLLAQRRLLPRSTQNTTRRPALRSIEQYHKGWWAVGHQQTRVGLWSCQCYCMLKPLSTTLVLTLINKNKINSMSQNKCSHGPDHRLISVGTLLSFWLDAVTHYTALVTRPS